MRAPLLASPRSLLAIARTLNLEPALCLDAASAPSYAGGQTWRDVSGFGRDFVLGADANASTDDPTFRGQLGQLTRNEAFEFDGGDFFLKSSANDAFFNGLHKDAAAWTLFAAAYIPDLASPGRFFATRAGATTSTGVLLAITAAELLQLSISNGAANVNFTSTAALTPNAWNLFGASVTINGASFFFDNGVVDTFTATVASPSAGDAAQTARIGADGAGGVPMPSGTRLGCFSLFPSALSQAQFEIMRTALRQRYET
jgi:hypothetical protein